MNTRLVIIALALSTGGLALSSCGLVKEGAKAISEPTTVPGQTTPPDGNGNANAMACVTERQQVELAVESYDLLNGTLPTSEADLVPDYLRIESTLYDITPAGEVVPAPGSGC